MKTGVVTKFVIEKNFGFVKDIETGKDYFFLLDKKEQIQLKKGGSFPITHIRNGDVLTFSVRESQKEIGKEEACNLIFIENLYVNSIKSDIERGKSRYGSVKRIGTAYYLTDKEYDITFPIKVLHEEKYNIDFDFLEGSMIEYFLEQRKNPTKIYAKLKLGK